ncbi:MAG: hypothetical protein AAF430_14035 [Myxococcota bacterium]
MPVASRPGWTALVIALAAGVLAAPIWADTPERALHTLAPRNPFAADGPYPMSHHDPGQTDTTVVAGPTKGKPLTRADAKTVPVSWCSAPIVKKVGDHTTVIAGTPHGLAKIDATGENFALVSFMSYPGSEDAVVSHEDLDWHRRKIDERRRGKQDWRLLFQSAYLLYDLGLREHNGGSGAYGIIDRDGYHYTFYDAIRLLKSTDGNERDAPLRPIASTSITEGLPEEAKREVTRILGISMTYDGHLAVASKGGLFIFDRELVRKDVLLFPPGEHVENSIAVDEKRIYVVTSKAMRGVAWDGKRLSVEEEDGGWVSPYEALPEGEAISRGAASHGSGTTPTLMGFGDDEDKLVLISDGSRDGAQLVAFWRDAIPEGFEQKPGTPSRRVADAIRIQVSPLTVEASPAAYGTGVIVLNSTYPESAPAPLNIIGNAFLAGETRPAPRGAQKFDWNVAENRFEEGWFLEDIDNTDWMPPAISPQNGLAYVATRVDSVYEYRAIDFATGETVARWTFPDDSVLWNNWGGITTLLEDGDLLLGGWFAVKRYDVGHLR